MEGYICTVFFSHYYFFIAIGSWNYFTLQTKVSDILASDHRNKGVSVWVHYNLFTNPNSIFFDLRKVTADKSAMDISRVLLQLSDKLNGDNTQDPEAAYNVKTGSDGRRKTTYGYKIHANVDEDGFIKKTEFTAGNIHDSRLFKPLLTGNEKEYF